MWDRADAGGRAVETTRTRLRQGYELRDRTGGHARMYDERVGNQSNDRDRIEFPHQIVGRELHRGVERVCGGGEQERVAVGIRACNRCRRELATGAWARLHDHWLTPGLLQMFPDDASKYIA